MSGGDPALVAAAVAGGAVLGGAAVWLSGCGSSAVAAAGDGASAQMEFSAASLEARAHSELPTERLLRTPLDGREPVVVVSCGSFSPPTLMHLRLMEDAKDRLESTGKYTVVGGYLSPCHAAYGKASLVDMHHRLNMCKVRGISSIASVAPNEFS